MKKAVGGKTRVDLAVDQIIQVILDRDMKAGDKLPNEYDLARELGVGRSTLREAIKRLVARNILTARQGAGTFVSEKNGVPEDPLGLTFMMEEGSENLALDLQDIRLMLEPETCAIVARGATPEQIDQMQAYCDEATRLIEAEEDYSAADAKFHQYLAECSGNHVLPNLIPIIASAIGVVITVTNDEHRSQSGMEHQRIVDAIRRHDPEGAKYSMIAFVIMVVAIFCQVVNRNIFKIPVSGFEEAAKYSMAYMVLLGTELGLRDGTQIAIKGVVDKLKGKVKKVIVIISQIIVVAFAAIMTKASFAMVLKQAAIGQTSPGLGIPMSVPYFSLVLGFGLIAVVQAGELVSMIVHFNKPEDEMKEEVEA